MAKVNSIDTEIEEISDIREGTSTIVKLEFGKSKHDFFVIRSNGFENRQDKKKISQIIGFDRKSAKKILIELEKYVKE